MAVFSLYDVEVEVNDNQLTQPIRRGRMRGWPEIGDVGLIRQPLKPGCSPVLAWAHDRAAS